MTGKDGGSFVEPAWTIEDVAAYLRVSVETVRTWRKKRTGPPGRRAGKHLRYDPERVRAWLNDGNAA